LRSCPTCGAEWDDSLTACPADDTPLAVTGLVSDLRPVTTGLMHEEERPARLPADPAPAAPVRWWTEPSRLASFLFDPRLHPFALLGDAAVTSYEGHRQQFDACARYLLRERQRPDSDVGPFASRVLDDPRMVAARGWDASAWALEPDRYRRGRPEWFQVLAMAELFLADGRISAEELESLTMAARKAGLDADAVLTWLAENHPSVPVAVDRRDAFVVRLFDGTRVSSTPQLRDVALRGRAEWQGVSNGLADIRAKVEDLEHPDAVALAMAIKASFERFPLAAGADELRRASLRLDDAFRRLGWSELRLPEPWSVGGVHTLDEILGFAAGDIERLRPAVVSGRLGAWLLGVPGGIELSGLLDRAEDDLSARRATWTLLWRLGEIRFRIGDGVVLTPSDVRATLVPPEPADRALVDGTLRDWANVRGFVDLSSAIDLSVVEPSGLRAQALAWRLGEPAFDADIRAPEQVVEALQLDPGRANLVDDPAFRAWVRARGGVVPEAGSASRRMHEALWSLGVPGLVAGGVHIRDAAGLVALLEVADATAIRVLNSLEPLAVDGVLGRFLDRANVAFAPTGDLGLDVRVAAWSLGWRSFHHPNAGFRSDPEAVAAWADEDPRMFERKLESGWITTWLELAWPDREHDMAAARRKPIPTEVEAVCRALGAVPPRVIVPEAPVTFGSVAEGATDAARLVVQHPGPRGLACIEIDALPQAIEAQWVDGPRDPNRRRVVLRSGQSATLQVTFSPPVGRTTRISGGLRLVVDGAPRAIGLQARSAFDLGGLALRAGVGAVIGAILLGGTRYLVNRWSGGAYVTADGGYVMDAWQVDATRARGLSTALWVGTTGICAALLLGFGAVRLRR
jgi:hypothetical protein